MIFSWTQFWQSISIVALASAIGGLFKMYSQGIAHQEQLDQLRETVGRHAIEISENDKRVRAMESTMARIDTNVATLLRLSDNGRGSNAR